MKHSLIEVRSSPVHGRGVFARRPIRRGRRVIEYGGERVPADDGYARYDDVRPGAITLLFVVDDETVIDGGTRGNEARFINHSCQPNCESYVVGKRVFIRALRDIAPGEELFYSYDLVIDDEPRKIWARRYRCHCGTPRCRGTTLARPLARKVRALLDAKAAGAR